MPLPTTPLPTLVHEAPLWDQSHPCSGHKPVWPILIPLPLLATVMSSELGSEPKPKTFHQL